MRYPRKYDKSKSSMRDQNDVWGKGPDNPKIVIVGEAPGAREDEKKEPFVGPSGGYLQKATIAAGINDKTAVWKTNVITKRPPSNNISCMEAELQIELEDEWFWKEIDWLIGKGVKVIAPVGNTALRKFGIEDNISKVRGFVFPFRDDVVIIPTWHPSFILRGMFQLEPAWVSDFDKMRKIAYGEWKPIKEQFNLFPSSTDVKKFVDSALKNNKLIACDIEKTGGLHPQRGEIVVIGLAVTDSAAITVPFIKKGNKPYWKPTAEAKVKKELQRLFENGRFIFQNALFDVPCLEHHGYNVVNVEHDTLLQHHAVHPEMPHNLEYIASIYGRIPRWKDIVLKNDKFIYEEEDEVIRSYNARDTIVLLQCFDPLYEDLNQYRTREVYENISMKLVRPVMHMIESGMKLSKSRQATYRKNLTKKIETLEKEIRSKFNLPEPFSFSKDDDVRLLLYGDVAPKFERAVGELATYDEDGSRKKKNTKKYRELDAVAEVYAYTPQLKKPKGKYKLDKTKAGLHSVGDESLITLIIAANNRLDELSKFVRWTDDREQEKQNLLDLLWFLEKYRSLKETNKLKSTFLDHRIGPDGRVHFPYKIHGTATGRLASGDKKNLDVGNAQNIPKEYRKLFVAEEGNSIIQLDYSNLELRIVSWLADDDKLQETFAKGLNVHDMNTRALFGIDKDDPRWDKLRLAAKRYIFGRTYGGTPRGIHHKVLLEVPDIGLTYHHFVEIDQKYRELHPKIAKWTKETIDEVLTTRVLRNAFGRVRQFLGDAHSIEREGINFPVQSTAADLMNTSLIKMYEWIIENPGHNVRLIGSVHDSMILECPAEFDKFVADVAKTIMERKIKVGKYEVSFPVDVEIGPGWGDLEEVEL
jgi:uracil-DNA glycosylase family 4